MAVSNEEILALTRKLTIPVPWDRDVFIEKLAQQRGRPIRLIPTDTASLTDSPCGLWLVREHDDLILHEIGTSEYHIDQIICHEVGHMILGHDRIGKHEADIPKENELYRTVLPDIDPATVRAVLGRMDYASDQERDAEMFANLLMIVAAEEENKNSMMRNVFFRRRSR